MRNFLFICFIALLFACNNNASKHAAKDSTVAKEDDNSKAEDITMPEVEGVYQGVLPCADCPGISTTIQLSGDSTFLIEQVYKDRNKGGAFYSLGTWSLKDSIVSLKGIKDGPSLYKATLNGLEQLDMQGKEIVSTGNQNFGLPRIANKSFTTKSNIPLEGMFVYFADSHLLTICATGKTYPVELTKETVNMEKDYSALKKKDKEALLANVEGTFELRPSMEGDKQVLTFVIKKFIKFLPGEKCK